MSANEEKTYIDYHDYLHLNKDYYEEFTRADYVPNAKPKTLLDCFDKESNLYKLTVDLAKFTDIDVESTLVTFLGLFSGFLSQRYTVARFNDSTFPPSLYTVVEHPPGTSKSKLMETVTKGFERIHYENKNELNQGRKCYITNTTSAALEQSLIESGGFFTCFSSEQSLIDGLFGINNADKPNDNEIVLNGFTGSYSASMRVTRKAFSGHAVGNVVTIAQYGTISKILNTASGTGLAERFLFVSNPSKIGYRDHLNAADNDKVLWAYFYDVVCYFYNEVCQSSVDNPLALLKIKTTEDGYTAIKQFRQDVEPFLRDGANYSSEYMRGFCGKLDMYVLKVAANYYKLDHVEKMDLLIPETHIKASISFMTMILEKMVTMLDVKEYDGYETEKKALVDIFVARSTVEKPLLAGFICNLASKKAIFNRKGHTPKQRNEKIMEVLNKMVIEGELKLFEKQNHTNGTITKSYQLIK